MLVEIKGDLKLLLERQLENGAKLDKHIQDDEIRFSSLNRYATSIAIVAGAIGASWGYVVNLLRGSS